MSQTMPPHCQLVMGPAGVGKSTYCQALQQHAADERRRVHVANLDPAAEVSDKRKQNAPTLTLPPPTVTRTNRRDDDARAMSRHSRGPFLYFIFSWTHSEDPPAVPSCFFSPDLWL